MSQSTWCALAAIMLGVTNWLFSLVAQPGTNIFVALAAGLCAWLTVLLIVAAARN